MLPEPNLRVFILKREKNIVSAASNVFFRWNLYIWADSEANFITKQESFFGNLMVQESTFGKLILPINFQYASFCL